MSQTKNNLVIGNFLHYLSQCDSTNSYVKELTSKSKPLEGAVFYTDNQTDGRGQFGNSWESETHKNIALSIILYPTFLKVNQQFYLSKMVSVAIVETLQKLTNMPFQIKWPNDIYYKNKKIGGILIENQLVKDTISQSIIGIGLNVNQEHFDNLPQASSLFNIVRYYLNKDKIVELLLSSLDAGYLALTAKKFESLDDKYHEVLKGHKEEINFIENGETKTATLKEVNEVGQLVLIENNVERTYNFKEITWVL